MPTQSVTNKVGPVGGGILGFDVANADTVQEFKLGTEVTADDGNTYVYVEASAAIAAYAACLMTEDGKITELTTALSGAVPTPVVFPQLALASGEFGWAVKRGHSFSVLASAACAADVKIGTTTTAGVVDDTYTDLIQGLRLNATVGGAQAATSASAVHGAYTNAQD